MIRAFVAAEVEPLAIATELAARLRAASPPDGVRWTKDAQLHVTLAFLGDVDESMVPALGEAVRGACVGEGPSDARVTAFAAFPSPARARVIAIELESPRLDAIARDLAARCEELGLPRDKRPFRAHLTIARMREPRDVRAWLSRGGEPSGALAVAKVTLFRSELGPGGPKYTALAQVPLDRSEPR